MLLYSNEFNNWFHVQNKNNENIIYEHHASGFPGFKHFRGN